MNVPLLVFPKSALFHCHRYFPQQFGSRGFQSFSSREDIFPYIFLGCNIISPWGVEPSQVFPDVCLEDEATSLVWAPGDMPIYRCQAKAGKNHLASQGSTPTIPFRRPSPIRKPVSQYSGPAQCHSFPEALWLGRFPYLESLPSFCRLSTFCFRVALS